jgi:alpha-tubulin suppressor-like RCC1 family protein
MRCRIGLAIVTVVAACAESMAPVPGTVSAVSVSPDSVSIRIGHTLQMRAVLLDSAGDTLPGRLVTWHSSDTARAVISATGLVTARNYGPVTISATSDTISGTAAVRVLVPVARVDIPPFGATLVPGGGIQFTALLTGVDGSTLSDRDISWSSQTPTAADVSVTGAVTAAQVGQTAITATSEGVTSAPATVVVTRPTFVTLFAGESARHTCGLTTAGAAFCWGDNIEGALGNGTLTSGLTGGLAFPIGVLEFGTMSALAAGAGFTCAVATPSGLVSCWGAGDHNKLGNNSVLGRPVPGPVLGNLSARDVVVEHQRGCLLTTDSLAYCWGDTQGTPAAVPGGVKFAQLAGGEGGPLFCGVGADSLAYCGFSAFQNPQPVAGGIKFIALTVGFQHVCGIGADSLAYCWGQNSSGQLGDSTTTLRPSPVLVAGAVRFVTLAAGGTFTCGLATSGAAYCWGANDVGQLGRAAGAGSTVPLAVSGGLQFAQIVAGELHACGLTTVGVAYCWGYNGYGQLGDGTKIDRAAPVRVQGQP